MGDQDLAAGLRGAALCPLVITRLPVVNPAAQAGGTEVVGLAIHRLAFRVGFERRDGAGCGEVGGLWEKRAGEAHGKSDQQADGFDRRSHYDHSL